MNQNKDFFLRNGYFILKNAIPKEIIKDYQNLWIDTHTSGYNNDNQLVIHSPNGWSNSNSYLDHKEILDILCHDNIFNFLNTINPKLVLHLSFTGWTSTLKSWHQDWTKSDKHDAENYIGAWVALENIHPDSGPFQFIPGSHLWKLDYEKIYKKENLNNQQQFIISEAARRKAEAYSFVGETGDIIFWSGHLIHRGSVPSNFDLLRKSIIGHYGIVDSNIESYQNGLYYSNKFSGVDLYK